MAGEIFKIVGRIALDGVKTVEKGMKTVQDSLKKTESSLKNNGDGASTFGSKMASGVDKAKESIKQIETSLQESGKKMTAFGEGLASTGSNMTKMITAPIALGLTAAIKSYADLEQAVGGIETLFKDSAGAVIKNSESAYKRAGVSGVSYMEQVTSFSATLLQGLDGDTVKAAEYADKAIVDMSDNANKFGTDIGMIQNAYQGFAKDNFTMLDNLKLGYGGTAGEMARLVNDSGVMGESFEATAENVKDIPFDQLIEAIHQTQVEMDVTGTTAKEASETVSGSFEAMKAAGSNLLSGLGDANADIGALMGNMEETIGNFARNVKGVLGTIWDNLPLTDFQKWIGLAAVAIGPLLLGIGTLMTVLGPVITAIGNIGLVTFGWIAALVAVGAALVYAYNTSETFRNGVQTVFQAIVAFVTPILNDFIAFIKGVFGQIIVFWNENGAMIKQAFSNVFNFLMQVVKTILPVVMAFVNGFIQGVKNIIQGGVNVILGIVKLFGALFTGNWRAAFDAVKQILGGAIQFIIGLLQTGFLGKAFGIVRSFGGKIASTISSLGGKLGSLFSGMIGKITGLWGGGFGRLGSITSSVINGVRNFVSSGLSAVASKFSGTVSAISSVWGRVSGIISRPINAAVNGVRSAVGKIAGFFRGMKISFPKIKLPHFKVSGKLSIAPPSVPKLSVDWYKEGGLFNGPSIIGVGEQPGVSEAVLPLRDDVFAKIGAGIRKASGQESTGVGLTQILVKVFVDGEEISSVIEPIITELQGIKSDQDTNNKGVFA